MRITGCVTNPTKEDCLHGGVNHKNVVSDDFANLSDDII